MAENLQPKKTLKFISDIMVATIAGLLVIIIARSCFPNEPIVIKDPDEGTEVKIDQQSKNTFPNNKNQNTTSNPTKPIQTPKSPIENKWFVKYYHDTGALAGQFFHTTWDLRVVDNQIFIEVVDHQFMGSQKKTLDIIQQDLDGNHLWFVAQEGGMTFTYDINFKNRNRMEGTFTLQDEFIDHANEYLKHWVGVENGMGEMGNGKGKIWLSNDPNF